MPSQRAQFCLPGTPASATARPLASPAVYLCGNSLGLQPSRTRACVLEELDMWAAHGVEGHFLGARPWVSIEDTVVPGVAALVGAAPSEVAVMGSLTANLHALMASFYVPTASRFRILTEARAFPSDAYAVAAQAALHGFDATAAVVEVAPAPGADTLVTADIVAAIAASGPSLAVVLLPGVQYLSGQALDVPAIVAAAHAVGAVVGVDLAHAIGNVPLALHDWDVDFAVWCSYKYLNAGPGGIAGLFVHERHTAPGAPPRPLLAGWWGHQRCVRGSVC